MALAISGDRSRRVVRPAFFTRVGPPTGSSVCSGVAASMGPSAGWPNAIVLWLWHTMFQMMESVGA